MAQGWNAVKSQVQQSRGSKGVGNFYIKDGESKKIQFIENEPTCIYEHVTNIDGKWKSLTCLKGSGEECPLCENGESPRFVGKFTIIDYSEANEKWRIKMYTQGIRVLKLLEQRAKKEKGLNGYIYEVTRTGNGVDTLYNFDTIKERALTEEEKKSAIDFGEKSKPMSRKQVLTLLGQDVKAEPVDDSPERPIEF